MVKIALAGFAQGYYATNYLRYLARLRQVRVIAVCGCGMPESYHLECAFVTAQAFAAELDAPLVDSYDALLTLRPHAILLCSETAQHVQMAARAVRCGIHVFVSKPLCFCAKQAEQLLRSKPPSVRVLCGNPLKYEQGVVEARRRVQAGEIGSIYSLRITVKHRAMVAQAWERDEARSGGPFGTYGVYLFDLARWISGQCIDTIYALSSNFATPEISASDTVKLLCSSRSGTQFTLELYSGIQHDAPFVEIEAVGTQGTLCAKYDHCATQVNTCAGAFPGTLCVSDMGAAEMDHFLACVQGQAAERCSVADMLYVAQCIETAQQSIKMGLPAKVGLGEKEVSQ